MNAAVWVFSGLFVAAFAGILVTLHLCEPPEYRRPMYRKTPRARRLERTLHATITGLWAHLHRPQLPRRPVRDLPAEDTETLTWVRDLRLSPHAGWLRLVTASTVWQAITHHLAPAAIPPTETPGLDYSDTSADWAGIREQLFAMLAADVTP